MPKSKKRRKAGPSRPRMPLGQPPQIAPVFTRPGYELLPEVGRHILGGDEHADHLEQLRSVLSVPGVFFVPFDTLKVLEMVEANPAQRFDSLMNDYVKANVTPQDFFTWDSTAEELVLAVEDHLGVESSAPLNSVQAGVDAHQHDILEGILVELSAVVPEEVALRALAQAAKTLMEITEKSNGSIGQVHIFGEWQGQEISHTTNPAALDQDLDAGLATGVLARLFLGEGYVVALNAEERSTSFGTRTVIEAMAWWVVGGDVDALSAEQALRLGVHLPEDVEYVEAFDMAGA